MNKSEAQNTLFCEEKVKYVFITTIIYKGLLSSLLSIV